MLENGMEFLQQLMHNGLWFLLMLADGMFLCLLFTRFTQVRSKRLWKALLFLTFGGACGMVIWVGDNNLLFTLPVFFSLCLLCTLGDRVGRLAVTTIFFCLTMSICALLDTYLFLFDAYDVLTRLARPLIFGGLWLALRKRLPERCVSLPRRLWKLVLGLAMMPLCALASTVLLGYRWTDSQEAHSLTMNLGLAVLPFVALTAVVLLFTITALADHERLEQASRLTDLREVYYQDLREQESQVRQLRHDLRNHLTAVQGLLNAGETKKALDYLDQMAGTPALRGTRRLCENETANVVLSAKAETMERLGIAVDFAVSLPESLPVADTDLAALLGNALDNAMEAASQAPERAVTVRCRADKGLLMLRVENPVAGPMAPDLATTKADKAAHGFGLPGMREIAARYGGTLEAGVKNGRFELVVCLPLKGG